MTYERITTKDHEGAVRTVTLDIISEDGRFVQGYEVSAEGSRSDRFHLIDTSTITRRRDMEMDNHYGTLRVVTS